MKSLLVIDDGGGVADAVRLALRCAKTCAAAVEVARVLQGRTNADTPYVLRLNEANARAKARFERSGIAGETHWSVMQSSGSVDELVRRARVSDLIIIRQPSNSDEEAEKSYVLPMLFETGRPVLAVPPGGGFWPPRSTIVAWNDSVPAAHALSASVPLLHSAADIRVVALSRDGSRPGTDGAVGYLGKHGLTATGETIETGWGASSRARGRLLLKHADERSADLIVMGAYGDGRVANFLGLGGATAKIMSAAKILLLLAH
jgi:nucleotide-binding universal stress UspA family protein